MMPFLASSAPPKDVPGELVALAALFGLFAWSWWRRRQGEPSLAPALVWPLGGLIGLVVAGVISQRLNTAKAQSSEAARWPVVTGRVVRSVLRTAPVEPRLPSEAYQQSGLNLQIPESQRLDLLYRYQVDHRNYEGSVVTPGNLRIGDQEKTLALRFPEGLAVPVYYNPTNPAVAVLDPVALQTGNTSLPWTIALFSVGLFVLGWWDRRPTPIRQ
jgi:Protein of unknown function (DUF3592)